MTLAAPSSELPVVLTVAGSDSGAGAGIQADLLSFAAQGVFGTTALTCLTAQNPDGVSDLRAMDAAFVTEQMEQVRRYFSPRALKTGMLFDADIIRAVAAFLRAHGEIRAVVDPVMVATSGATLLRPDAVEALKRELFPLAAVVTPNLDEVAVLTGRKPRSAAEMTEAGHALTRAHGVPFFLKGGHLPGDEITDLLVFPDGATCAWHARRIDGVNTHGSGCTLSAALAAHLARGADLAEAIARARDYLHRGLRHPLTVAGTAFIAH